MSCNKTKYGSKKLAEEDIYRIQKKSNRTTVPIRSYLCNLCDGKYWHITSKEDKYNYSEMELKRIKELEEEITKLKEANQALKSGTLRELAKEVKVDQKVKQLKQQLDKTEKMLIASKKNNAELICKIVKLEKIISTK